MKASGANEGISFFDNQKRRVSVPTSTAQMAAHWDWNDLRLETTGTVLTVYPGAVDNAAVAALASRVAERFPETLVLAHADVGQVYEMLPECGDPVSVGTTVPSFWNSSLGFLVAAEIFLDPDLARKGHGIVVTVDRDQALLPTLRESKYSPVISNDKGIAVELRVSNRGMDRFYSYPQPKLSIYKKHVLKALDKAIDALLPDGAPDVPKLGKPREIQDAENISDLELRATRAAFKRALSSGGPDGFFTESELPKLVSLLRERLDANGFEALDVLLKDSPNPISAYAVVKTAACL